MRKAAAIFFASTAFMIAGSLGDGAGAQDLEAVPGEYLVACAVCHGESGKGDGALTREFGGAIKAPDLTQLAKNNDGEFPFLDVFHVVDGRTQIGGHGTRVMPVWGDRYKTEMGDRYGPYGSEEQVRARVLELVYYIQSIQEE